MAAALAPLAARNSFYNPTLVLQTYIWLQEIQARKVALGDTLDHVFEGARNAGYRRLEVMPAFVAPELRDRTIALLRKYKLEPLVLYGSGPLHEAAVAGKTREQVLESAKAMHAAGARFVNFNPAPKSGAAKTDDELATESYQLNRLGEELRSLSMELLFHHHLPEMAQNAREWRYLLAHTDPPLVSACIDVAWAARAQMDPLALVHEAGGRLGSLHLRNSLGGVWQQTLAGGEIPMAQIAAELRRTLYDGLLVVELAYDPQTPRARTLESALSRSRWYVQEVFGSRPGSPPVDMGPHVRTKL